MVNNRYYYLGFSYFLGIGPVRFSTLVTAFGTPAEAYQAKIEKLESVLGKNLTTRFDQFRRSFDPVKKEQELKERGIIVLTQDDSLFPQKLRELSDPPICLYLRGDLTEYNFAADWYLAVVGTRKPTAYGQYVVRKIASDLASNGWVIVSGLAIGIDALAHQAALDVGGRTIAFLGCGVDIVYPPANARLYQQILDRSGLIVSEFPPGMRVQKGLFVARNRLISGLSRGVFVVEGLSDSGSLITARYAANQGKDVFAAPGPINSPLAEAPNLLLKQGAKLVTSVTDILEEYHQKPKNKLPSSSIQLSYQEKLLVDVLTYEPLAPDELAHTLNWQIHEVLTIISSLELQGMIEKNIEGRYQLKPA